MVCNCVLSADIKNYIFDSFAVSLWSSTHYFCIIKSNHNAICMCVSLHNNQIHAWLCLLFNPYSENTVIFDSLCQYGENLPHLNIYRRCVKLNLWLVWPQISPDIFSTTPSSLCVWQPTCLMAVSPILSECFRMLSRKSRSCDMAVSRMWILSLGMFSAMMEQKRYWPALGRQVCSSCSSVRSAG